MKEATISKIGLAFAVAVLLLPLAYLQAAISLGPSGTTGTLTFNTAPAVGDWATRSVGTDAATIGDALSLQTAATALDLTGFTNALPTSPTLPPSANALYRYNTNTFLQARPTGVDFSALLATVQNDSGAEQTSIIIGYDFAERVGNLNEQIPGWLAFYSLSGAAGSWTPIPEFSDGLVGAKAVTLSLTWPAGTPLYLMWVDDNAANGTQNEGAYTLDNFRMDTGISPPTITRNPDPTNAVQCTTFSLTVAAEGTPPLSYFWYKGGLAMDQFQNPSVITPTLVVTNAQLSDEEDYYCKVSNIQAGGGGEADSAPAHVTVTLDEVAPLALLASGTPDNLGVVVMFNEPMSPDVGDQFNYIISSSSGPLTVSGASLQSPTTILVQLLNPMVSGERYTIALNPQDLIIKDACNGNFLEATNLLISPVISLQEGNAAGYVGTQDTRLRGGPTVVDTVAGADDFVHADTDDTGGAVHGLLQFNIFGGGAASVPLGAQIISARLILTVYDAGTSPVNMHRMLVPWEEATATWNSMTAGISADGVEAVVAPTASFPGAAVERIIDVTSEVASWSAGTSENHGWAFLPSGTDGWRFRSSEFATVADRPELEITYVPPVAEKPEIITEPAATVTINEGGTLTLSVLARGGALSFDWRKGGVSLGAPNSSTYTKADATPGDSGTYSVRVHNSEGEDISADSVVTVVADSGKPTVVSAIGSYNLSNIVVTFSEPVSQATAEALSSYGLNLGAGVSAALQTSPTTVLLTTTTRTFLTDYTLTVRDVQDLAETPNTMVTATFTIRNNTRLLLASDATWKYEQTANLDGETWYQPAYADAAWASGQGLFGLEASNVVASLGFTPTPAQIRTPWTINVGATQITYYVRTTVTLPAQSADPNVVRLFRFYADDSIQAFVNGTMFAKVRLTNDVVLHQSQASGTATEGQTEAVRLNVGAGTHTLAAEIHQSGTNSSDIVFGAEIVDSKRPTLNITYTSTNTVHVSWTPDPVWQLVSSGSILGTYGAVGAADNTTGNYSSQGQSAMTFYQLRAR